jgi:hypothetical protein
MLYRTLAWACAACLVAGCGQERRASAPLGDDAGDGSRNTGSPEAGTPDIGTHDAGDPNGTMDRATALRVGEFPGVFDSFDGREDKDFFAFDGGEGQWVSIRSVDRSGLSLADTPLFLFGPDRQRLAGNRYAPSLLGEDLLARIITRLPADGRYYIEVSDPGAPSIAYDLSQPYRISVVDANATDGYTVNVEGDDPTPARFAHVATTNVEVDDVFLTGSYDDADDLDAFAIDVAEGPARLLDVKVDTDGKSGNGSTTPPGTIWITDATGATVLGKIDASTGQTSLTPPLDAGRYVLWTKHPATNLGTNDFYVVRALIAPENPVETSDATNGSLETAEPLAAQPLNPSSTQLEAFVLFHVGDGDVDYFRFDGQPGQTASISCVSSTDGSGVVGLHLSARNDADEPVAEATETSTEPISVSAVPVSDSGKLYLRLSKDGQLPDVAGDWGRCVISAG